MTQYGRKSSEDFLATWTREGENDPLWGAAELPPHVAVGADARYISYKRDLGGVKTEQRFIMQVEGEVALRAGDKWWIDFSRGQYNGYEQTQRAYALYQASENFYLRAGKFFAPFGIYEADHTTVTRRQLGFDQGMETINLEAGVQSEAGEIILTGVTGGTVTGNESFDPVNDSRGAVLRVAGYLGGNSQAGLSLLSTANDFLRRSAGGPFVMTGIGRDGWYLGEIDLEQKSFSATGSIPARAVLSHHKIGWEGIGKILGNDSMRGLRLFVTWDSLVPVEGDVYSRQWSAGPGIQWFPRPHFEASIQVQRVYHEARSREPGQDIKMMAHMWL